MSRNEKSSRDLEQEIQRTRERLERELRALEERLHPGHLFEQMLERLRAGGGREFIQNLGRSLRDNPLPVALTGVGIAWLAVSRSGSGPREPDWQIPTDAFGERLQDTAERVQGAFAGAGERARQWRSQARQTGERLGERARGLYDQLTGTRPDWQNVIEEQPLLLGLAALALGAGVAAAIASTRTANRPSGSASAGLRQRTAEETHEQVARTRERAERLRREHSRTRAARREDDRPLHSDSPR